MNGDTAAALRQIQRALRHLLGARLIVAATDEPQQAKAPTNRAAAESGSHEADAKRSEAKASSG